MPVLAAGYAWALWSGRLRPRSWTTIVALQAVLLGAGLVAMNTGEREEGRVDGVVPEAALERHEALAQQFVWATGAVLLLAAVVLVARRPAAARALTVATVAGSIVVTASAMRVGHAGGQLVYEHNAGAAYSTPGRGPAAVVSDAAERRLRRDHHD